MDENRLQEWSITEYLPRAFVDWLNKTIVEKAMQEKKGFIPLATEIGVEPGLLSRWLAGMGPFRQEHVQILDSNLGSGVYAVLGLIRPIDI